MPDLHLARGDLGAFAEMAGWPLAPFQVRALTDPTPTVVIVAPRQSGKSRSLSVYAAWRAFREPGRHVLIVSASEDASRRLLRTVRDLVAASPLLAGSVVDEQAGLLTLTNGSEVRSVPASERAIRGWSATDLLLDEAALLPEPIYAAAKPTVAARPDARIIEASSATTSSGPFFDDAMAGERGSEHVRTHRWALADAPWLSASFIAGQRESMSEVRFAAEFEGRFAGSADSLFSVAAIERATADFRVESLSTLRGPARVLGGCDWGATTDRSAFVAIARLAQPGERVFAVCCAHRWAAGEPLTGPDGVVQQIARSDVHFQALTAEANGLGQPLAGPHHGLLWQEMAKRHAEAGGAPPQRRLRVLCEGIPPDDWAEVDAELRRRPRPRPGFRSALVSFTTTAEAKAATASSLRLMLDAGRLLISAESEDLLREMRLASVDLSATGTERISASAGHDDLFDALWLACWPQRQRGGGWTNALAALANPARSLPEPPLAAAKFATPTVLSGGGRRVPRCPPWVSVAGPEVSLPNAPAPIHGDQEEHRPVGFHGRL